MNGSVAPTWVSPDTSGRAPTPRQLVRSGPPTPLPRKSPACRHVVRSAGSACTPYGLKVALRTKTRRAGEAASAPRLTGRSAPAFFLLGGRQRVGRRRWGTPRARRRPDSSPLTSGPPPDGGGGRALSRSPCGWERAEPSCRGSRRHPHVPLPPVCRAADRRPPPRGDCTMRHGPLGPVRMRPRAGAPGRAKTPAHTLLKSLDSEPSGRMLRGQRGHPPSRDRHPGVSARRWVDEVFPAVGLTGGAYSGILILE
jgi:hypothetical protein